MSIPFLGLFLGDEFTGMEKRLRQQAKDFRFRLINPNSKLISRCGRQIGTPFFPDGLYLRNDRRSRAILTDDVVDLTLPVGFWRFWNTYSFGGGSTIRIDRAILGVVSM